MKYEESEHMCADIYTKLFTDVDKWAHACELIGVFDPHKLGKIILAGGVERTDRPLATEHMDSSGSATGSGGGVSPASAGGRRTN
eukprot:488290-Lingulodinium_polyedra.AAC.1